MAQNDAPKTGVKPTVASNATTGGPVATTKSATDKDTATTGNPNPAAVETAATERGDVGTVSIRKSTREITSVRSRTSTDPVHVAVKDAVKGEWYDIEVDDDGAKIERVARKLRAAAQKYDVGMNIHPDNIPATNERGDKIPGRVIVSFRTGDRDKRAKTGETSTTATTDTKTESAKS